MSSSDHDQSNNSHEISSNIIRAPLKMKTISMGIGRGRLKFLDFDENEDQSSKTSESEKTSTSNTSSVSLGATTDKSPTSGKGRGIKHVFNYQSDSLSLPQSVKTTNSEEKGVLVNGGSRGRGLPRNIVNNLIEETPSNETKNKVETIIRGGGGRGRGLSLQARNNEIVERRVIAHHAKDLSKLKLDASSGPYFLILSSSGLNKLTILPLSEDSTFYKIDLLDSINAHLDTAPSELSERPILNEVVIGKYDKKYTYPDLCFFRGVVVDELNKSTYKENVSVKDTYTGQIFSLPWKNLFPVNSDIMKHPIFTFEVELHDVSSSSDEIIVDSFTALAKYYSDHKIKMRLQIIKEMSDGSYKVELKKDFGPCKGYMSIKKEIECLGQMEWEKMYELGHMTDNDIMKHGSWVKYPRCLCPMRIKKDIEFTGIIASNYVHSGDSISYTKTEDGTQKIELISPIYIKPLLPALPNYKAVLWGKWNSYVSKVKASPFFPGMYDECFMLRPNDKWRRGMRVNLRPHAFYDVDNHEIINADEGEGIQFRCMIPDFRTIPSFAAEFSVIPRPGLNENEIVSEMTRIFKSGEKREFIIRSSEQKKDDKLLRLSYELDPYYDATSQSIL